MGSTMPPNLTKEFLDDWGGLPAAGPITLDRKDLIELVGMAIDRTVVKCADVAKHIGIKFDVNPNDQKTTIDEAIETAVLNLIYHP